MLTNIDFLCDDKGGVITAFHGTYYVFDYFFPLSHFGSEKSAQTVLKEGKWKRDKNININSPKIIPVHFRQGNYFEIPDLNNHYVEDWQAIILAFLLDKSIIQDIDDLRDWKNIQKKCDMAASKPLSYQYDFISQPIRADDDIDKQQEIDCESLYTTATSENVFLQRMIRFFESVGVSGFVYKNFTESGGDNSYIIFRQNNVIRTDKEVPPMATRLDNVKLQSIEQCFVDKYESRSLTVVEKESWIKQLRGFYDFRKAEIARQKTK